MKERALQQTQQQLPASEQLVSEFQQNVQQKDMTISDLQQTISAHERKIQQLEQQNTVIGDQPQQQSVTEPKTTVARAKKDRLEVYIMYYAIGVSVPSLHRESLLTL